MKAMSQSNILYIITLLLAAYLTRKSNKRPNPPPPPASPTSTKPPQKDLLLFSRFTPNAREYLILLLQTGHILLSLTTNPSSHHPSSPPSSPLCPDASSLNAKYFHYTLYSTTCLAIILAAASLRLTAMAHLGRNFTFELAAPAKLITSGFYAYVQHPSYPTDIAVTLANLALFANPDGWIGCFLSAGAREAWMGVRAVGCLLLSGIAGVLLFVRTRQEEQMLRETFGEEWEVWHRKTARYIPFVF